MLTKAGGPEVLQCVEIPFEPRGPGQWRVRVRAAGVGSTDLTMLAGNYAFAPRIRFVPGYEIAGTVDAAAVILNDVTAWQMIHRVARVRPGQTAAVTGAAGGVGTALRPLIASCAPSNLTVQILARIPGDIPPRMCGLDISTNRAALVIRGLIHILAGERPWLKLADHAPISLLSRPYRQPARDARSVLPSVTLGFIFDCAGHVGTSGAVMIRKTGMLGSIFSIASIR
jgi:hypothetical protein